MYLHRLQSTRALTPSFEFNASGVVSAQIKFFKNFEVIISDTEIK